MTQFGPQIILCAMLGVCCSTVACLIMHHLPDCKPPVLASTTVLPACFRDTGISRGAMYSD